MSLCWKPRYTLTLALRVPVAVGSHSTEPCIELPASGKSQGSVSSVLFNAVMCGIYLALQKVDIKYTLHADGITSLDIYDLGIRSAYRAYLLGNPQRDAKS